MKTFKSLILSDLKTSGNLSVALKIKSIKYKSFAGGDSVSIKIVDPTPAERETIKALAEEYKNSSFDSMIDLSFPKESKKPRSAKFVHIEVEYSPGMKEKAKQYLSKEWGITNDQECKEKRGMWLDMAIWRDLNEGKVA